VTRIAPRRRAFIAGATWAMAWNTALQLTAMTAKAASDSLPPPRMCRRCRRCRTARRSAPAPPPHHRARPPAPPCRPRRPLPSRPTGRAAASCSKAARRAISVTAPPPATTRAPWRDRCRWKRR
jgi:hypothetical protein